MSFLLVLITGWLLTLVFIRGMDCSTKLIGFNNHMHAWEYTVTCEGLLTDDISIKVYSDKMYKHLPTKIVCTPLSVNFDNDISLMESVNLRMLSMLVFTGILSMLSGYTVFMYFALFGMLNSALLMIANLIYLGVYVYRADIDVYPIVERTNSCCIVDLGPFLYKLNSKKAIAKNQDKVAVRTSFDYAIIGYADQIPSNIVLTVILIAIIIMIGGNLIL